MSRGFCYLVERHVERFPIRELTKSFEKVGVSLANPWNGLILELTHEGDQLSVTDSELAESIESKDVVTFQLWFSEAVDIVCSYRHLRGNMHVHAYSFDGLDLEEEGRIRKWALQRFRRLSTQNRAVVVVIDPKAVTVDYDWDEFVQGRIQIPTVLPGIFGVDEERFLQFAKVLDCYLCEPIGESCFVFTAD